MGDCQGVEVHDLAASDHLHDGIDGSGVGVGDEARPRTLKGVPVRLGRVGYFGRLLKRWPLGG